MGGYRHERVAEMIHKEVARRLRTEIKDPRLEPISLTHISVTKDLRRAVIQYCPLGGGAPSDHLRAAVDDAARAMRGPIGRALRLRHAPELVFEVDTHTDQAMHVNRLLEDARREREVRSESDDES